MTEEEKKTNDQQEKVSPEDAQKFKEQMAEQFKLENIMKSFLSVMTQKAWESLGVMDNPYSGSREESLENAKISIDTVDFLFKKIVDRLPEQERSEIRANLTNMKMKYVSKVKESKSDSSDDKGEQ